MTATRVFRNIQAPRAKVYAALLDAEAVATWMVPLGMKSHVHAFEAHEGGSFRITLTYEAETSTGKTTAYSDTYHGRFVELVPNQKVVQAMEFETNDPAMQGVMTVTYMLSDARGGGTDLRAIHDALPRGVSPQDNETGWQMALAKLAELVEVHTMH
jgi:uncharacterized protein YndB with AHSA1/START domain